MAALVGYRADEGLRPTQLEIEGVVFEVVDGHLDRVVALKLLPYDALAKPPASTPCVLRSFGTSPGRGGVRWLASSNQ